jgi:hypothetical protein
VALDNFETMTSEEIQRMIHELRRHQFELEVRNEELICTQKALDAKKDRYFDFYALAPVGYFTINESGLILEANLAASRLWNFGDSIFNLSQPF